MQTTSRFTIGLVLLMFLTPGGARAQQTPPSQTPPAPKPTPAAGDPQDITYKETVVVSASKTEQQLVNAPATMTVIGQNELRVAPSTSYADLLRSVPGVNITQISARDVNVTSRAATGSLATSQLALLDGRSLYLDFFGFIMWDFMPVNLDEIKQIEVIRGPASAIWGANALSGVINVITKSPREMQGTTFTIGTGEFGKEVVTAGTSNGAPSGSLFYVNGTHAAAVNDRLAYKISVGTYASEPLARPSGLIPNGLPNNTTQYPAFKNSGTSQPKVDARVDYDLKTGAKLQVSGGVGGTNGIMHSGIGPFDIASGTKLGYGKVNYTRKAFRLQAFSNILDGNAKNLLTVDQAGAPINFVFNTKTTDFEAGDTRTVGTKQAITYGGNLRFNKFHLTIAPGETSRTEGGAYVQDEVVVNDRYRLVAGARVDKFSSIDNAVFSPRVAFLIKPEQNHTLRLSYNRAFRSPSMINNNLDVTIANPFPLAAISPALSGVFLVPTHAGGNKNLTEEHVDSFEVGYTGNVRDRAIVSAAWYYTKFSEEIFFTQDSLWDTPPPGWAFGPAVWGQVQASAHFPREYTYKNLGQEKNKGIELGIDGRLTRSVTGFVNYSFQADPIPEFPGLTDAQARAEINLPAKNRYNVGITCMTPHGFGSLTVTHTDKAFWQDVLDDRFHGETAGYTMVSLTLGTKWGDGKYTGALKMTNLNNQQVLQHIFGDIIRRQIVAELKIALPK